MPVDHEGEFYWLFSIGRIMGGSFENKIKKLKQINGLDKLGNCYMMWMVNDYWLIIEYMDKDGKYSVVIVNSEALLVSPSKKYLKGVVTAFLQNKDGCVSVRVKGIDYSKDIGYRRRIISHKRKRSRQVSKQRN